MRRKPENTWNGGYLDLQAVQREIDRVPKPGGLILVTDTSSRLWPREVHSHGWLVS